MVNDDGSEGDDDDGSDDEGEDCPRYVGVMPFPEIEDFETPDAAALFGDWHYLQNSGVNPNHA